MKVLVACEFSGTVGSAFHKRGHDVLTCDLLPTETPEVPHHQGDVLDVLQDDWDLMVAHPPCTYLANSGVRWLHEQPGRWRKLEQAAKFFKRLHGADVPRICVENPVPHLYGKLPEYTQTIQPWQFGHGETKRTCLWLKNLPPLQPTNIVEGREARVHRMPPGLDRQKERSRFFTGVAEAMAEQWGEL